MGISKWQEGREHSFQDLKDYRRYNEQHRILIKTRSFGA